MHNAVMVTPPVWEGLIDSEWTEALDSTPFLKKCREGKVTVPELKLFLAQQYFYSRHFTRYLCALLSNLVDDSDRIQLTDNLVDESGKGTAQGVPHSLMYRRMLEKMGVNVSDYAIFPETQALVSTMLESCRNANTAVGLGALCLGAEAIVPRLYTQIVHAFESQGYAKSDLEFFYVHIACDDEHAVTMKEIIERAHGTPEQKRLLKCSAARAIAARVRFFEALSKET